MRNLITHYIPLYVFVLGISLILYGFIECLFPLKVYSLWKKWIHHKLYPLQGLLVTIGGLPLTFFRSDIPGKIMLCVGLITIFSGPFILLFPDRIRQLIELAEEGINDEDSKYMIYSDAVMKGIAGSLFIYVVKSYNLL